MLPNCAAICDSGLGHDDHPIPACKAVTVTEPAVELFVSRHATIGVVIEPMALLDPSAHGGVSVANRTEGERREEAAKLSQMTVCTENLNTGVLVMESAQNGA